MPVEQMESFALHWVICAKLKLPKRMSSRKRLWVETEMDHLEHSNLDFQSVPSEMPVDEQHFPHFHRDLAQAHWARCPQESQNELNSKDRGAKELATVPALKVAGLARQSGLTAQGLRSGLARHGYAAQVLRSIHESFEFRPVAGVEAVVILHHHVFDDPTPWTCTADVPRNLIAFLKLAPPCLLPFQLQLHLHWPLPHLHRR